MMTTIHTEAELEAQWRQAYAELRQAEIKLQLVQNQLEQLMERGSLSFHYFDKLRSEEIELSLQVEDLRRTEEQTRLNFIHHE